AFPPMRDGIGFRMRVQLHGQSGGFSLDFSHDILGNIMRTDRLPSLKPALAVALLLASGSSALAQGLHGYIASSTAYPGTEYTAGIAFHAAVWSLIDNPVQGF